MTKYSDCCNAEVDNQGGAWVCTACKGIVDPLHCSDHQRPTREEHETELNLEDKVFEEWMAEMEREEAQNGR